MSYLDVTYPLWRERLTRHQRRRPSHARINRPVIRVSITAAGIAALNDLERTPR